jgi:hypothetical protein
LFSKHLKTQRAQRNAAEDAEQQEVERLQGELEVQKKSLEQMQETARRAGYGSAVWDP